MVGDDERTWLIDVSLEILEKSSVSGADSLSPVERLIESLSIVDYGMMNAGDLEVCFDISETFLEDGLSAAQALELPVSTRAFSLPLYELEQQYNDMFCSLIEEIKSIFPGSHTGSFQNPPNPT